MPKMYGWVREIVPESLADVAALQPGDLIESINGKPIRDLLDYRFAAAEEELTLTVKRQETMLTVAINKLIDDDIGVLFGEEPAPFIRGCANKCVFCFIDGLPKRHMPQRGLPLGMRDSLYIKDDDYRYSFMFGNFITLTNLKEHDWQRLEEQRLTPLYVSVHATDADLRRQMVDGPRAGDIIGHIKRLGDMGITVHTQLVMCPGMNDGEQLDRSISDLAALRPIVESISAVPVGLTKFNNMMKVGSLPTLRPYQVDEARAIIHQVSTWQERFIQEMGEPFVFLSDEWYYITNTPFPKARHYGQFSQIENGVGMTRAYLDDWGKARRKLPAAIPQSTHITLVTATMAEGVMAKTVADLNRIENLTVELLPVVNQFFGPLVTVAGLLCGNDIIDAVQAHQQHNEGYANATKRLVLLPRIVLDNAGTQFLDDVTVTDFQERIGDAVVFTADVSEIIELITALATDALPSTPVLVGGR